MWKTLKAHWNYVRVIIYITASINIALLLLPSPYHGMLKGVCGQKMSGDHSPDTLATVTLLFSKSPHTHSCICAFALVLTSPKGSSPPNTLAAIQGPTRLSSSYVSGPSSLALPPVNPHLTDSLLSQAAIIQHFWGYLESSPLSYVSSQ